MLKKIIDTIKATVGVWFAVLLPLLGCVYWVKSTINKDIRTCIDTFMQAEGVGLSKYMGLQFENSQKEFETIMAEMYYVKMTDKKILTKKLRETAKANGNIVSINVYDEEGKFLGNSGNNLEADIKIEKDRLAEKTITYEINQLDEGDIVIKYSAIASFVAEKGKIKKYLFELIVKWDQYEKYMMNMHKGSIPRMFYIISPDCKRYISLNSLPPNTVSNVALSALGMHLTKKINDISFGLSDVNIESIDFRILKEAIKMPKKLSGNNFFAVVVTDSGSMEQLNASMFDSLPAISTVLLILLLLICLVIARFFNKTKEQLEIANVISDSTPLALVIFKASDGSIMKINLSASTLLRIAQEEVPKINMWSIFIEEDDRSYVNNATASNINVLNYEVLIQSFGGGTFWSICSASPIDVDEEKYIVLAVLDINRRKEIEKKLSNNAALLEKQIAERTADLEQKAKELEVSNTSLEKAKTTADEANSAKSKFLTNMSNELKTPLNAIIGYSEILEEEALDRKDTVSADDLRKIIGSAKHLLSLIDEILDLSKIESGKTQLFFENIDLVSLIKDVEGITMPLIAKNENSMFLEYQKDIGIMYSDSTKIRQCLLNLLSNAAKFTEFGKITLRISPLVKAGEDFIEFSVIDTGVGIEADKLETLFESFNDGSSGKGLGLSITKKYVECLGGTITIDSEIGAGSKFVVRLPRTCKTISSESVEVKNQGNEEELDEIVEEIASSSMSQEGASVFTRKSDNI
ncbi:MAG: PAS domain-containing sensor histidine kinase [Holosporaceae bacterium]|jgi:PAS domain S-box-containing protein|nr:PAS domain-containing sensor histidine kinase [Holosporaceae bacterium]